MTIVTVALFPIALLYQGWSFDVFRARLRGPEGRSTDDGALRGQPG